MKVYWDNHNVIDAVFSAISTFAIWKLGELLPVPLFVFDVVQIKSSSLDISGILAGILGLIAAVISFSFSAIELKEFRFLKGGVVERQFWQIFGSNIIYITLSIFIFVSFYVISAELSESNLVKYTITFVLISLMVNLLKFSWLIYQMVAVKRDQAALKE